MLIVCSACVSSYKIDPATAAQAGAALRCAHCRQPLALTAPLTMPELGTVSPSPESAGDRSALRGVATALLALASMSAALFWHEPIARAVPGAAALYRFAGLPGAAAEPVVRDLKTVLTPDGLKVEGTLANPGRSRVRLPHLRLTLRDSADDALASWVTAPPKTTLGPGETVTFTSHLDKPPAEGHDLAVSFSADRVAVSDRVVKDTR